jgi:peroxiredoxin Q/BCP
VSLETYRGTHLILYFYPKDDTAPCTATACGFRDHLPHLKKQNIEVVGVSADDTRSHKDFAAKFGLTFPLIADVDLKIIKAYDVWGLKEIYGRQFEGIVRTTFVIDPDGRIADVITDVNTSAHVQQVLKRNIF